MNLFLSQEAVQEALAAATEARNTILAAEKPVADEAKRLLLPENINFFSASYRAMKGLDEFIVEARKFIELKGPVDE